MTYTSETKIAILLATFNSSRYLHAQLDSLFAQTCHHWVLYVRDGGSQDNTLEILEYYRQQSDRIVLVSDQKGALCARDNFMTLLEAVDAPYYMFCDHDDVWLPEKVALSLARIQQIEQPNRPALVCTDLEVVDQNLEQIHPSFWDYMKLRPNLLTQYKYAISCNLFTGCTLMFNQAAKQVSLPMSEDAIMHDAWIGLRTICSCGAIGWIDKPQIRYRQHASNVCGAHQVGVTWRYFIGKITDVKTIFVRYGQQYRMANAASNTKISLLRFLYYRIVYLLNR